MGCVSGKVCHGEDEIDMAKSWWEFPVHEVSIESFELSKYEVTFEEYDRFTAATGRRRANDEGWGRGRHPVINVSWEDAVAYKEWLSAQTGVDYRLPSEAEWEYAARAGSSARFYSGDDLSLLCRYENHPDMSLKEPGKKGESRARLGWYNLACSDGLGEGTAAVGSYQPNAFGVYDIVGNVSEWVQDCVNNSYRGAPRDGSAWLSGNCSSRLVRGGDWGGIFHYMRISERDPLPLDWRSNSTGFLIARTITP